MKYIYMRYWEDWYRDRGRRYKGHTDRVSEKDWKTEWQSDREIERQSDRDTERQSDRETER